MFPGPCSRVPPVSVKTVLQDSKAAVATVFSDSCLKLFVPLCIMAFLASFANCAGNTVFNASLMLALPEKNRGAILGFIQAASVGGTALSAVLYGLLGDAFPLYLVFTVGNLLSLGPMLYLCFNRKTKEFVINHQGNSVKNSYDSY